MTHPWSLRAKARRKCSTEGCDHSAAAGLEKCNACLGITARYDAKSANEARSSRPRKAPLDKEKP